MAFWNESAVEPKRKFKFILIFGASATKLPIFVVKKVNKPEITISVTPHKFLGHTYKFPGSTSWNEVTVTLIDPAGSGDSGGGERLDANTVDVSSGLYRILEAAGYQNPVEQGSALAGAEGGDIRTFAKSTASKPFDQIKIVQLNASGDAVETWTLNNAWLNKVAFGDLDYSSDDISEVTLTFAYDWAGLDTRVTSPAP